jgi:hypothetical protein
MRGVWKCTNTVFAVLCILAQIHHGIDFGNGFCNILPVLFMAYGVGFSTKKY